MHNNVEVKQFKVLPRKGVLAIAAVADVALHKDSHPIPAKILAARHDLHPRHLELVLQALVREGILKSFRGPRGGYKLGRERMHVTANDILRAAGRVEKIGASFARSELASKVVIPMLSNAERAFGQALSRINLEDMARRAENLLSRGNTARAAG